MNTREDKSVGITIETPKHSLIENLCQYKCVKDLFANEIKLCISNANINNTDNEEIKKFARILCIRCKPLRGVETECNKISQSEEIDDFGNNYDEEDENNNKK